MSKKKTQTTQTNTYGWEAPKDTADITALRGTQFSEDPGIAHQYGLLKERQDQAYDNPLGGYTTPDVRMKQKLATNNDINQQESMAHRQGQYDVNMLNNAKLQGLAALTAPKLVQTGGTGTTTQNDGIMGILGPLIGAASTVGAAAMTGGASSAAGGAGGLA